MSWKNIAPVRDLGTIKDYLSYDPATGRFAWRTSINPRAMAGEEAGCLGKCNGKTYRLISWGKHTYLAHRLAWWWTHGEFPPEGKDVDHANRGSLDNRIDNLRLATRSQNAHNGKDRKRASRFIGVSRHSQNPKWWVARISKKYLGIAETEEGAARLYDAAAREHFGEFARLNFPEESHAR